MNSVIKTYCLALAAGLLSGCIVIGDEDEPITALLEPATQPNVDGEVVIVLPGIGADAQRMKDRKVAEAVHASWPQADVLLTNATFAYYVHNVLVQRLDEDILRPARNRYRKIWLAGASVGGMGALLYERAYPKSVNGIILMAPWLGSDDMLQEIRDAGGIAQWDPGPLPAQVDKDNYEREMWRVVKQWSTDPKDARRVWLVCGTEDRLLEADRLLAAALPPSHYLEVPGGHTWEAWLTSAQRIIAKIRAEPRA